MPKAAGTGRPTLRRRSSKMQSAAAIATSPPISAANAKGPTTPRTVKVVQSKKGGKSVPRRAADPAAANMRGLAVHEMATVCDVVGVVNRFESASRCSAVAPDTTVWTGEMDGTIAIRLAPSGAEVGRIDPFGRSLPNVMAHLAGRMWIGYTDGAIRVLETSTQKLVFESTHHTAAVHAICAADGFVYTGSGDWKVYQWEADDLHFCRMFPGHRSPVRCLTTYRDPETNRRLVVSGSDDGTVKVWDALSAGSPLRRAGGAANPATGAERDTGCVATLDGQCRGVLSVLVLEDTAELWVGCEDTAIRVWDLYTLTVTSVITTHQTPVMALRRVEETVWSGSKDGTLVITNRFTKEIVHHATNPPLRNANSAVPQRFHMAIQPVTRTVVYNVWATGPDGSWQCWNFTAPETVKATVVAPSTIPAREGYPEGHYFQQLEGRVSAHTSLRRSHQSRSPARTAPIPITLGTAGGMDGFSSGGVDGEDAELRASVARIRQSVTERLTDTAKATLGDADDAADAEVAAEKKNTELVAESIRNDRQEAAKRDANAQRAILAEETKRGESLRAKLRAQGRDPDVVLDSMPKSAAVTKKGRSDTESTEALERLFSRIASVRQENVALAAAASSAQ